MCVGGGRLLSRRVPHSSLAQCVHVVYMPLSTRSSARGTAHSVGRENGPRSKTIRHTLGATTHALSLSTAAAAALSACPHRSYVHLSALVVLSLYTRLPV